MKWVAVVDDALLELAQEHFAIEFPADHVDFLKSDDFERNRVEGVWTTIHDVVEGEQRALRLMTRGVEHGFWPLSLTSSSGNSRACNQDIRRGVGQLAPVDCAIRQSLRDCFGARDSNCERARLAKTSFENSAVYGTTILDAAHLVFVYA